MFDEIEFTSLHAVAQYVTQLNKTNFITNESTIAWKSKYHKF